MKKEKRAFKWTLDGHKLRNIRKKFDLTQTEFGKRFGGFSLREINSYESGECKIPFPLLAELQTQGYSLDEFFDGEEKLARANQRLPVVGFVVGGTLDVDWHIPWPEGVGFEYISRPDWLRDLEAFAVMIKGDSMYPPFRERTVVVVSTRLPVFNGDMAVVRIHSGQSYWKIYREKNEIISLEPVNAGYQTLIFKAEEVLCKYKVVEIILPR